MFFENIKEAIISILSNKMRSLLTMLGIIIGISSVIIITTIGGSIQSTLTATMNSLGGNTVSGYVEARYPEAVSYTHLDVYKRQLHDTCKAGRYDRAARQGA